jgi:hypothetical protein
MVFIDWEKPLMASMIHRNSVPKRKRLQMRPVRSHSEARPLQFESLECRQYLNGAPITSAAAVTNMCTGYQTYQVSGTTFNVADQMESILKAIQSKYSGSTNISKVVDIGNRVGNLGTFTSPQKRSLWAIEISDNVNTNDNEIDEPSVAFVSTMHGNEPDGTILSLKLIDELLRDYSTAGSPEKALIDKTDIWIVPLMNPDGLANCTRNNFNGVNLNRAFPDLSSDLNQATNMLSSPLTLSGLNNIAVDGKAPEAAAVMQWTTQENFVLAANFHQNGGVAVVNYPYDYDPKIASGAYAKSPDDDLFKYISKVYASHDPQMWGETKRNLGISNPAGNTLTVNKTYPFGITNGSDWFAATGTMQDWRYRYAGTNEVTVEVRDKTDIKTVDALYLANRDSMLAYLQTAHVGVTGVVTGTAGSTVSPVFASVEVTGSGTDPKGLPISIAKHFVFSDSQNGSFFRMLPPGRYPTLSVTVSAPNYCPQTRVIKDVTISAPESIAVPPWSTASSLPTLPTLVTSPDWNFQLATSCTTSALTLAKPVTKVGGTIATLKKPAVSSGAMLTGNTKAVSPSSSRSTTDMPMLTQSDDASGLSRALKQTSAKPTRAMVTDLVFSANDWSGPSSADPWQG